MWRDNWFAAARRLHPTMQKHALRRVAQTLFISYASCSRNCGESRIWLRLCVKSKLLLLKRLRDIIDECTQLMNIIGKSIVTAKANAKGQRNR
jgi:hypothetical protein